MKLNLISTEKYSYLANNMFSKAQSYNMSFSRIALEHSLFPDYEYYYRISNSDILHGVPAVFVCGTIDEKAIFDLYNIACALVSFQCSSIHLVIPYFGYSTMERASEDGEIVVAKNIARLISSIPLSVSGNYLYMIDLHSQKTKYYFEGALNTIHLTAQPIIAKILQDIAPGEDVVMASADMGRAKYVERLSNKLGLDAAFLMKKRISAEKTTVIALSANVSGRTVVICDDMIRSGTTIINAARAYKNAGARRIFAIVTHGVFTEFSVEKLKECKMLDGIFYTNTHPNTLKIPKQDGPFRSHDISDIILSGLQRCI